MNALSIQVASPCRSRSRANRHCSSSTGLFYPALMITLGAIICRSYSCTACGNLPPLGAILVTSGVAIGMYLQKPLNLGSWLIASLLFLFAFIGRHVARRS